MIPKPARKTNSPKKIPSMTAEAPAWLERRIRAAEIQAAAANPVTPRLAPAAISSPAVLTIAEAAQLMRISVRTVRRLVTAGELSAVRIGRSIRFRRADVEGFLGL
jgi:excisionase family DNA binding protein